jgi:dephospho-CoA kinase
VIIDSDVLAREVVAPGTPGLAAVRQAFGDGVVDAEGHLDRPALGAIVFADPDARRRLEQILHPLIQRRAAELEEEIGPEAVAVHVIPLLVEVGRHSEFDRVVVVDVPVEVQRDRIAVRDGLTAEQAQARIDAQISREERLAVADHLLVNTGSLESLRRQVLALWDDIRP